MPGIQDPALQPIYDKVAAGKRLNRQDGCTLFESADLLGVGRLAQMVRERLHGRKAFYIYNQHINYSNICVNGCKFCAFSRKAGEPGAYEMSLAEIFGKVEERAHEPITEIHIVGGCHPDLPFAFYLDMLRGIKARRPEVHLQAFTAVEIAHLADKADLSVPETLAGLEGGGAGVAARRRRRGLQPPGAASSSARKSSRPRAGWKWPRRRTAWISTPTPPCSTATWRPWRSGWTIWSDCEKRRMRPGASWPSFPWPSTPTTPA